MEERSRKEKPEDAGWVLIVTFIYQNKVFLAMPDAQG